ncbi:hypothetical protein [Yokenella regensburgei]|nr:hypothetical protein [Yokenella regensburgei]
MTRDYEQAQAIALTGDTYWQLNTTSFFCQGGGLVAHYGQEN